MALDGAPSFGFVRHERLPVCLVGFVLRLLGDIVEKGYALILFTFRDIIRRCSSSTYSSIVLIMRLVGLSLGLD